MASPDATCMRCSQRFKHKSSAVRHSKRCHQNLRAPSRQKSCRQCTNAKARCDLQRPHCGRCQSRSFECEFQLEGGTATSPHCGVNTIPAESLQQRDKSELNTTHDHSRISPTFNPHDSSSVAPGSISYSVVTENGLQSSLGSWDNPPGSIAPELVMYRQRSQIILGTAHGTPSTDTLARHTMFFIIRVLRSWPRMMAMYHTSQLPPIIHSLQLAHGLPMPLANCYTLVNMWDGHEDASRELVSDTIFKEVKRLLHEHQSYNELILLAATQSLLILITILFFGTVQAPAVSHPVDAQLLVELWDVKKRLTMTGVFLDEEISHTVPSWKRWAIVSAKRRTILALHHLEWAWSLLYGYPILTCFELAPLPAPEAGYLWREHDEKKWERDYSEWLFRWKEGSYKIAEIFHINPGGNLNARSEMWLAEVDEFGMMLMTEVNAISHVELVVNAISQVE